jgi:preprotein translocase subunit Sec63
MITPYIYRLCYLYSNNFPKYNSTKNYYSILNISQNSKKDTIRNAFLNLAKKYHPDLNPNGK